MPPPRPIAARAAARAAPTPVPPARLRLPRAAAGPDAATCARSCQCARRRRARRRRPMLDRRRPRPRAPIAPSGSPAGTLTTPARCERPDPARGLARRLRRRGADRAGDDRPLLRAPVRAGRGRRRRRLRDRLLRAGDSRLPHPPAGLRDAGLPPPARSARDAIRAPAPRAAGGSTRMAHFVPYHDRTAIEEGALAGRGLEIAWAADPIDLFFLQIQGSGRLRLPDGGVMRIGYAEQNGRDYVADRPAAARARAASRRRSRCSGSSPGCAPIRRAGAALMRENPSYVFFRELTGPGPLGSLGVPVTARRQRRGRSRASSPMARRSCCRAWTMPRANGLWVAQDTGGAIRGANRFDTFWGAGEEAALDRRRRCRRGAGRCCCCRAARWRGSGAVADAARLSAEEAALWRQVVDSVTPLHAPMADAAADAGRRGRLPPAPKPAATAARRSRRPPQAEPGHDARRELGPAARARALVQPDRSARSARPQSRHRLRPARPHASSGRSPTASACCCWSPASRRRTGAAGAARSARRSATGWRPRAMPATSPRCATPIRAMAGRARSTSSCGGGGSAESRSAPAPPDHPRVDARQGADVLDRGRLVELVHGRVGQAEIDHRAERDQEAAVRGAAMGREARA